MRLAEWCAELVKCCRGNYEGATRNSGNESYLKMCNFLITMCHRRMVITLVYYGLSLSAGELAGSRYVNNFLSGLVEIPAYTTAFFILQR
jgi:hypothetical protein